MPTLPTTNRLHFATFSSILNASTSTNIIFGAAADIMDSNTVDNTLELFNVTRSTQFQL